MSATLSEYKPAALPAAAEGRVRPRASSWVERARTLAPVGVSVLVVLGAWWAYTRFSGVPAFLVPPPDRVLFSLAAGLLSPANPQASFLVNLSVTLQSALLGFALGVGLGFALATLAAAASSAERIIMPYTAALQSMPKLAVAPLFLLWFGYGIQSKVLLVALLVFFPVLVNTYRGIKETDPLLLDVMRTLHANRWQTLTEVQLPFAMPYVFAGLSVGIIQALLGAIVGEFVGAAAGIGVQLIQFQYQSDVASVFAALVVLAVVGALLSTGIELLRRRVVFWNR